MEYDDHQLAEEVKQRVFEIGGSRSIKLV